MPLTLANGCSIKGHIVFPSDQHSSFECVYWTITMNVTVNGVSSRSGKEQVMSARLPQDLIRALLSQLDRVFVWQVSPFSFFFCFLDQSPLLLIIYISPSFLFLFSPPLCHALVLTLTLFFYVCLLPVALCRALSLMYLRPPQAAVFTRPLQRGNRRRMTWSMFPAEESTAISLLQLSQPFFIMSCLCSSRYR